MDSNMEILAEMGVNLAAIAVKGTVSAVNTRIKLIKSEKDIEGVRNKYDEIVNQLLSEREEAVRIALAYKNEVDKFEISDQDIIHLHNTVNSVIDILKVMSPTMPIEKFEQFQKLINVDTLKAMQLLGFNYKAAIGEPLTELCANSILSKIKVSQNSANRNRK